MALISMALSDFADTTQLNSTSSCRHVHSVNSCHLSMNVVTQLTQFVGHDVINKNTTDLAVRCTSGSVELSWVELSCVAINTPLDCESAVQAARIHTHHHHLLLLLSPESWYSFYCPRRVEGWVDSSSLCGGTRPGSSFMTSSYDVIRKVNLY